MTLWSIAFSLFLLMDSVGNIPFYISFLKGISPHRQRIIIIRELLIALGIIMVFNFIGERLMDFLKVREDTVQISGGIILFLLALKMVFPTRHDESLNELPHTSEPFIVPLAVPLVAGPSVLAAVMIYAKQEENHLIMLSAIFLAWTASLLILLASSFLERILGWRGILALERLMGLILTLIAIQMFLNGVSGFIHYQR
ncbi:MAG: YhgN family NAAT transporter [Chlamydiales bacterium]|nr:YhgN family NAAT transporter [Chlamydiales bacterium]